MTEADPLKSTIATAAQKTSAVAAMLDATRKDSLVDIGKELNALKNAASQAMREILTQISQLREAQRLVAAAVAGSGVGFVANAVTLLGKSDEDLQEELRRLNEMIATIETWQRTLTPNIDTALSSAANVIRGAAGEFRKYESVL